MKNGPVVQVRRLHRRDLNKVWEFLKLSFRDVNLETVEYQRPRSKKRFFETYEEEGVEQLLFVVDGEIVAYTECTYEIIGSDTWINPRYFEKRDMRPLFVEELAVHPEWHGRGVGSFVLEQIQHLAKVRGLTHLVLEVAENNTHAMLWYRKRGFRKLDAAVFMAYAVDVAPELLPPRALDGEGEVGEDSGTTAIAADAEGAEPGAGPAAARPGKSGGKKAGRGVGRRTGRGAGKKAARAAAAKDAAAKRAAARSAAARSVAARSAAVTGVASKSVASKSAASKSAASKSAAVTGVASKSAVSKSAAVTDAASKSAVSKGAAAKGVTVSQAAALTGAAALVAPTKGPIAPMTPATGTSALIMPVKGTVAPTAGARTGTSGVQVKAPITGPRSEPKSGDSAGEAGSGDSSNGQRRGVREDPAPVAGTPSTPPTGGRRRP